MNEMKKKINGLMDIMNLLITRQVKVNLSRKQKPNKNKDRQM